MTFAQQVQAALSEQAARRLTSAKLMQLEPNNYAVNHVGDLMSDAAWLLAAVNNLGSIERNTLER